jgi:hypothetical protein
LKREFEWYGKLVSEGDPFNWINQIIDPEINVMRQQLKSLQNGLARLNSIIETNQLPSVGEDVAKKAKKEAHNEREAKSNGKGMKDKERKKRKK